MCILFLYTRVSAWVFTGVHMRVAHVYRCVCGCVCTCTCTCFLGSRTRRKEGSQSPIAGPEGLGRGPRRPQGPSSVPWNRSAAPHTCMHLRGSPEACTPGPADAPFCSDAVPSVQGPCRPPAFRGAGWGCSVIIQAPAACKGVALSCTAVVSFSRWVN